MNDEAWMTKALELARMAAREDDVPVGALVVCDDRLLGAASNRTVRDQDPTAHAEILAIRQAANAVNNWRLTGCTLYVTLEPCAMCAGAIVLARIERLVFGAWDEKAGMVGSVGDLVRHPKLNHHPEVLGGLERDASGELLKNFFGKRRG
jgi:tRNA(adenine34) deaminase